MSFDPIANGWRKLLKSGQVGSERKKTVVVPESDGIVLTEKQILGASVTIDFGDDGCYFLQDPEVFVDEDFQIGVLTPRGSAAIFNNDSDGILTKRALGINEVHLLCPTFPTAYAGYDALIFLYEETSDTMGLGITLPRGWYAINSTTFAHTPFDIEHDPLIIGGEYVKALLNAASNDGSSEYKKRCEFVINNCFQKKRTHTFTIQENNIQVVHYITNVLVVAFYDISTMLVEVDGPLIPFIVFSGIIVGEDDSEWDVSKFSDTIFYPTDIKVTYVDSIVPVDQKYIPAMDGVVLNSTTADSTKQFKLTVDDTGAITATEIA